MSDDFELLKRHFRLEVSSGGLLLFQCQEHEIAKLDRAVTRIIPTLKARNIGILLLDEEVTVVMVPEARRVLTLPRGVL